MLETLLDPLFLFFVVGFAGGVLRSELKLPEAVYHLLSTYLLLAIGLKGACSSRKQARRRSRSGGWAGLIAGLSPGGATFLATLTASASYIAAPAAVRVAIPEANVGLCVAAALGVTFPFNLALGIPLYAWWVDWLAVSIG